MSTAKGEFGFDVGGQRVHIRLNPDVMPPAPALVPARPIGEWSDEELHLRVAQVVTGIDALDVELRTLREEQKRRRSV
jgi:hypothetical protein